MFQPNPMIITPFDVAFLAQLMPHLIGDYVLQSDWMAQNKTKSIWPALAHVSTYGISFILSFLVTGFSYSGLALLVIVGTHLMIDHLRLARYVVFAKNFLSPSKDWPQWEDCSTTGYPSDRPAWLTVWLLIIADNIMHMVINALALTYL